MKNILAVHPALRKIGLLMLLLSFLTTALAQQLEGADPSDYLSEVMAELQKKWPENRTINLVFHGHSVPAGYWHNSEVHTLDSYPHIVLERIKERYPLAVVNVINTAIGGENSLQGAERMETEVLIHRPDVLFIDYALNDMWMSTEKVRPAWEKMIAMALEQGVKVILLTPSPDQRENILDQTNRLVRHAAQIRKLAAAFKVGLADPFTVFQKFMEEKGSIKPLMSHVNHPNRQGHEIIATEIMKWFVPNE